MPPHDVATFAGLPVAIPCSTDNELFSSFTLWRRDARPLYQDDDITIATNGTLTIQRSKVEHSGEYDCLAVNEKGIAMATINIKINSRPGIVNRLYTYIIYMYIYMYSSIITQFCNGIFYIII